MSAGRFGIMVAMGVLVAGSSLRADVIVDSHGFESPFFTTTFNGTGELAGQPTAPGEAWLKSGTGSSATIQTTVVASGSQAVRVDRDANSDPRWAHPVTGFPSGGNTTILMQWDMRVQQTAGPANTFGPFFGMEAYNDETQRGLIGSLGVDATTGEVLYQQAGTGFLIAPGPVVAFGTWNSFEMELDFDLQEYTISLNGTALVTEGFVDVDNIAGWLNTFADGDISALAAAGDPSSLALTGTAYFDNVLITQVPEPTSLALLGLAPLALLRRRR